MKTILANYGIALAALILSIINTVHAIYRSRQESARLDVKAVWHTTKNVGIEAINYGKRKIILNNYGAVFDGGRIVTSKPKVEIVNDALTMTGIVLGEMESFSVSGNDIAHLFKSEIPKELFVCDSTGKMYYAKKSKEILRAYHEALKKDRKDLIKTLGYEQP